MNRKRINISVDEKTYEGLEKFRRLYGFKTTCEVVVSLLNITSAYIQSLEQAGKNTENIIQNGNILKRMNEWYGGPESFKALEKFRDITEEEYEQYIDAFDVMEQQQIDVSEYN